MGHYVDNLFTPYSDLTSKPLRSSPPNTPQKNNYQRKYFYYHYKLDCWEAKNNCYLIIFKNYYDTYLLTYHLGGAIALHLGKNDHILPHPASNLNNFIKNWIQDSRFKIQESHMKYS
jgi:hypothetical protein